MEDRRDLDPAPPARRPATAAAAPPEAGLSGPGTPRDPAQRDTESPPTRAAAAGHPGHDPALAPRHRPPPLGCKVHTRQERQASHPPEHQGPGPPAGPRKFRLGLPQDPRRTGWAGSASLGVDGIGDPEGCRHRSGAAAERSYLVAVPALPGRGDPGVRLLHGGTARWHPGLSPGRDRARQQAHQDSRSHFASHRGMDRPAGPQPDHGSRRASAPDQVHDPRPRLELHRRVRRGPRRCRDPDRALQRPDTAHERDRRTLDRRMPPRAPGPHPGLEPGPSAADLARVRDPPQSAPAAPVVGRSCATETPTRTGRSRTVPRPTAS
jgi:hypothetical protein